MNTHLTDSDHDFENAGKTEIDALAHLPMQFLQERGAYQARLGELQEEVARLDSDNFDLRGETCRQAEAIQIIKVKLNQLRSLIRENNETLTDHIIDMQNIIVDVL